MACPFISDMPQILKLARTKSARDLSLLSWLFYLSNVICSIVYTLVILKDPMWVVIDGTCIYLVSGALS